MTFFNLVNCADRSDTSMQIIESNFSDYRSICAAHVICGNARLSFSVQESALFPLLESVFLSVGFLETPFTDIGKSYMNNDITLFMILVIASIENELDIIAPNENAANLNSVSGWSSLSSPFPNFVFGAFSVHLLWKRNA